MEQATNFSQPAYKAIGGECFPAWKSAVQDGSDSPACKHSELCFVGQTKVDALLLRFKPWVSAVSMMGILPLRCHCATVPIFCQIWPNQPEFLPVHRNLKWLLDRWPENWSDRQTRKQIGRVMIVSCSVGMSWCNPSCPVMSDRLAAHKSPERQKAWGAITGERAASALFSLSPSPPSTAATCRMVYTCYRTDYTTN